MFAKSLKNKFYYLLILLSASVILSCGGGGGAKRCKEAGFLAFLTKPLRQSDLFDCLSQMIGYEEKVKEEPALITRHSLSEIRSGNFKILLAEDNNMNRIVARAIFKKLGFEIDIAVNGIEAVEALKTNRYDIVFMDIQMPEMSGLEATRITRKGESGIINPKIPIVALTANAMKGDREICLNAGMDDYLTKPVSKDGVDSILKKWLGDP